jgi:hypothetical protein
MQGVYLRRRNAFNHALSVIHTHVPTEWISVVVPLQILTREVLA